MSAPGAEGTVAGFHGEHGFARAGAASTAFGAAEFTSGFDDPQLPPLRLRASSGGGAIASPCSSSSSDAFVSMSSTPSEALNPCGLWSPPRAPSEASSSEMEFGTAREYDTTDPFFGDNWFRDNHLLHSRPESDGSEGEDKFIVGPDVSLRRGEMRELGHSCGCMPVHRDRIADSDGCAEVNVRSSPPCGCCYREKKNDEELVRDSCSAVYGRYQIMDDHTEVLDECVAEAFRFRLNAFVGAGDPLVDVKKGEGDGLDLSALEKELQMLSPYLADADAFENVGLENLDVCVVKDEENADGEEFLKDSYSIHPFPESSDPLDVYGVEDFVTADTNVQNSTAHKFQEDPKVDPALSKFHQEYEVFGLRIFHRKNRTGFEENKEFPIVMDSVIAGRYRITEYLGSAAFSKVVRAHDLQTGLDVCLKIIKNDKDFFDQSLDEIKLLKFVNKYDPDDDHHILRLYDYFYFQEHLFIVTELLRANLYEFQKYNQESGDEVYFSLPRIQAIARQCLEALVYLHHLNIVHCDLKPENILLKSYSRCEIKVIDLGSSCFLSDNLNLYIQSRSYRSPEVILGLPYDQKIDIWSLGCILAELYTGEVLFPNESVPIILARMIGDQVELESKRRDLQLELESEKKSFDEKMKQKQADLVKREKGVKSLEAKLSKTEQALNDKKTKMEGWQNDLEAKSKALKRWEESLKNDEKRLLEEKQHIDQEKQQVEMSKSELESIKSRLDAEKERLLEEQNNLKLTVEERQEHSVLTEKLKKEIEEYRMRSNSLSEEIEDLRKQRQKFEEEWEQLDEKRAHLAEEENKFKIEKMNLERWRDSEEKRLNDAKFEMEEKYKEQLENLERKERVLNDDIKQKQMENDEFLKGERADLQRQLQLHQHELEMEIEQKQAIKEKELEYKENELNRKIDFVENELKRATELNESKIQKIISEGKQLQAERKILLEERQKLETDKADIKSDIDSLHGLSQSLKVRREAYNKDMKNLIDLFEKYKVCRNCGITLFEGLDSLALKDSAEIEHPSLAVEGDDRSLNADTSAPGAGTLVNSGGRFSLLQKCSRLFKFSPIKKGEQPTENLPFGARLEEASQSDEDYEPTPVYEIAHGSFDAEDLPSESGARENDDSRHDPADDVQMESSVGVADNSIDILVAQSFDGTNSLVVDATIASADQNGKDPAAPAEADLQPETSKQGRRQQNRKGRGKGGVKRTRSVRAVVEDAKAILGESFEEKNDGQGDPVAVGGTRKRRLAGVTISEQDEEGSEAHSESVSLGGQRRKRRQTAGAVSEAPGEKRYNLRRSTAANATAATAQTDKKKAAKAGSKRTVQATADATEGTSKADKEPAPESKLASESADYGTSQLHEFSEAEIGDAHAPAEGTGEEDGDVVDGKDALLDVPMTPSGSELGADQDDEDDDDSERRNQSISKKLWSFFTT